MIEYETDRVLAVAQVAWSVLAIVGILLVGVSLGRGFLVWFGGFLAISEVTPLAKLEPQTQKALRWGSLAGYVACLPAIYLLLV